MGPKDRLESESGLRNLRHILFVPLIWLVVGVILPDFAFGLAGYTNKTLLVVRHVVAAALMGAAAFYLLARIRTHMRIVLPTAIGLFLLLISQPIRIAKEIQVFDASLGPHGYRVLTLFEKASNALGLTVIAGGFLFGLVELIAAKQRSDSQHQELLREMEERRRAEEDRDQLATAIEQAAESVVITDPTGIIQYVNPAFERLTGYAREEAIGRKPRFLRSGKHDDAFYRHLWQTISGGGIWHGHFVNKRKDGSLFEEDATISCVRNASGYIVNYVALKRDVTNEVNLERQLQQAQKMEAMGTLAGHIAHDFNNILALILGYSEMSARSLPESHPVLFNVQHIIKAGNRARDLVKQILTFSRRLDHERKPVQIHRVVKEVVDFLRVSLPPTVELRSHVREDAGWVLADPTHIHQVVMNLCTNAYQAMEGRKGVLEVTLDLVHLDSGFIADAGAPDEGAYVRLCVRDTGRGMDAATLQRIFDPFFTTKKPGEGTGLGLSTVHGIVLSYGGAITVTSAPESGATFQVYIPSLESGAEDAEPAAGPVLGGREHILVLDDDPEIGYMNKLALEQLGYHVEPFTRSAEALRAFRADPASFDMVITDQVMPDMTGLEFAQELLSVRADLPIILITGFGQGVTAVQAKLAGISEYLMKPVSAPVLSSAIRRCLDKDAMRG